MLDLKKLEEKLDKVLADETGETLTKWLLEKRLKLFLQSLGEGTLEEVSNISLNNTEVESNPITLEVEYFDVLFSQEYLTAA